jgi:hypothetical protein
MKACYKEEKSLEDSKDNSVEEISCQTLKFEMVCDHLASRI